MKLLASNSQLVGLPIKLNYQLKDLDPISMSSLEGPLLDKLIYPIIAGVAIAVAGSLLISKLKKQPPPKVRSIARELKVLRRKKNLDRKDICRVLELIYENYDAWFADINSHFPAESDKAIHKLGEYMHRGIRQSASRESSGILYDISVRLIKTDLEDNRLNDISSLLSLVDGFNDKASIKAEWYDRYSRTKDASSVDTSQVNAWKTDLSDLKEKIYDSIIDLETNLRCKS